MLYNVDFRMRLSQPNVSLKDYLNNSTACRGLQAIFPLNFPHQRKIRLPPQISSVNKPTPLGERY
jgi:hypothetical protein